MFERREHVNFVLHVLKRSGTHKHSTNHLCFTHHLTVIEVHKAIVYQL